MTDGPGEESGRDEPSGETPPGASSETAEDGGIGLTRRQVLGGGVLAAALAGGGYYFLFDDSTTATGPRVPFAIWRELQSGFRKSPDNLPATATALVEDDDPEALYTFVRDEIALKPPDVDGNAGFDSWVDAGPTATLRAGIGTPREKADLLASLLRRGGYEASVVTYDRELSTERSRSLYFGGPTHAFDPAFDADQLEEWATRMGQAETGPEDVSIADRDGEASAALADRIQSGMPETVQSTGFSHGRQSGGIPVVRFRPSESETESESESSSEWQYADLFHEDESFGTLSSPEQLGEPTERATRTVLVSLETARMDAPDERIELVSGRWQSHELAGRQLGLQTLPGRSMLYYPTTSLDNVTTYVPALSARDTRAPRSNLESLSVVGDPFTLTGERYTLDSTGTLRRDGEVMVGEQEPLEFVVETPDGETATVTALDSDQSIGSYYGLQGSESDLPDGLEQPSTSVSFLYRNTDTGTLSLVTTHGRPGDGGGQVTMRFEGVRGMKWLVRDGGNDDFETEEGPLGRSETVHWGWLGGFNDGGAIGPVSLPFDIEMTHVGAWDDGNQERDVDRWVFVNGEDLSTTELADFTGDDSGDVTARIYAERPDEDNRQQAPSQTSVEDIDSFSVAADASGFPTVRITLTATDTSGNAVTDVPASAVIIAEDGTPVDGEAVPTEQAATGFAYRSPNRDGGDRTVGVEINGAGSEETTYEVPPNPTDPRAERGLSGLYLRMEFGDRTIERTLAGWDPEADADRDPNISDFDEVFSALWGQHTLSFETAGVGQGVLLDDEVTGKLTLEAADDAWRSDDIDRVRSVAQEGHGQIAQFPQQFHPRVPDRLTEDSLTYSLGLRTVLTGSRPVFGEGVENRWVDILDTDTTRTLRRDDDRQREFEQTLARTARRSVMEQANFETSTADALSGTTLTTADQAREAMTETVRSRFDLASQRRHVESDDYRLTAGSGETAAFWLVDGETGGVVGVLPDGSGGGSGEEIMETLTQVEQMLQTTETIQRVGSAGPPSAEGAVATFYGEFVAKLFAVATVSLATISTEEYNSAVTEAMSKRICNIAGTITESRFFQKSNTSDIAGFMNNLRGAKDHTASTCLQNDTE